VVWQVDYEHVEYTRLVDIFAQKISTTGALVGEAIPISTAHGHQWGPRVSSNNAGKDILTWTEGCPNERAYGGGGSITEYPAYSRYPLKWWAIFMMISA